MIDEICTCWQCDLADKPCHQDCSVDDECVGCTEARQAREDITHDIVWEF